jgi:type III restriction enzyme
MMLKEGWDVRNVKVIVPLRPCDSRTLTEQTLGRGLRKMHPPIIDEEGASFMTTEELYVIEHPSFRSVIDQIKDIIEEKSSGDQSIVKRVLP